MNDKKSNFNPFEHLENRYLRVISRYDSFTDKLNLYLLILTVFLSTFLFLIGSNISNINSLIFQNTNGCIGIIIKIVLLSLAAILFIILIFISIKLIKTILSALNPVILSDIDFESIDLYMAGKEKKSKKVFIKDLKYSIDANQKNIDKKYSQLYKINSLFVKLFITIIGLAILNIGISIAIKIMNI